MPASGQGGHSGHRGHRGRTGESDRAPRPTDPVPNDAVPSDTAAEKRPETRDRSLAGGTERSTSRSGSTPRSRGETRSSAVRAGTVRAQARARARQGPRRDPQRVVRRRHPLAARTPTGAAGAAGEAARRAARATGGALGLSTARRAAVLAVVVCALALTVAVPLRNYVTQRHEIAAVAEQQRRSQADVDRLTADRAALADPAHVEALARQRLGYARPGETPYRVQLPGDASPPSPTTPNAGSAVGGGPGLPPSEGDLPWYTRVARGTLGTSP